MRELKRNLPKENKYAETIALFERVLSQERKSTDKIYSLHEPHVKCIGKGKEHKKYEFGNKVSVIRSKTGIILGALSFGNPYDGHTIAPSLEQVFRLTGRHIKLLAADRGYRGTKLVGKTRVVIPDTPKKNDTQYQKRKKHRLFCKQAGIEPTIGHLKSDHRLSRNFYKGWQGDVINILLPAAAYNFKRAIRVLLALIERSEFNTLSLRFLLSGNRENVFCNQFYLQNS